MAEPRQPTLGDHFTLQRGTTYKSAKLGEPGPVLLGLATIQRNGGFRCDSLKTYGGDSPEKLLVPPGGLYVSLKDVTQAADLLGAVARLPIDHAPGRLTQDTVKLEPRSDDTPLDYLYWLMRTPQYREYCRAHSTGTTNLGLPREDFLAFPAPRPTAAQQTVVRALQALEDKIGLNDRMAQTLESIARAHFKVWFADVDPVRAKANALIADGMLEIGDGYRAKNSELGEPGLPFIRAGDLENGFDTTGAEVLHQSSVEKAGTKICRDEDVAFTSKGTVGRFARVPKNSRRFVYSPQVCYWRSADHKRLRPSLLYLWMTGGDLLAQIMTVAGQTDMAPYVSLRDQREMMVPLLPESQHECAAVVEPMLDRAALAAAENHALIELRDALLRKLISGELRVTAGEVASCA